MKIFVNYESQITSETFPSERYGSWSQIFTSSVTSVTSEEPVNWDYFGFEIPDGTEEVLVLYVLYSSGDTFGSSSGNLEVVNVYPSDELSEAKLIGYKIKDGTIKYEEVPGRLVWQGYFETLEEIILERFTIDSTFKIKF